MTIEIRDAEDEVLVPTFVARYKLMVGDYGDYQTEKTLYEDELTAATYEALADQIQALTEKTIAGWGKPDGNLYTAKNYDLPALERFKPCDDPSWGRDRWRTIAGSAPRNGFQYLEFEPIAIEMRTETGGRPTLRFSDKISEVLEGAMRLAHRKATDDLRVAITAASDADAAASRKRKEAQLAALKAELGEA